MAKENLMWFFFRFVSESFSYTSASEEESGVLMSLKIFEISFLGKRIKQMRDGV